MFHKHMSSLIDDLSKNVAFKKFCDCFNVVNPPVSVFLPKICGGEPTKFVFFFWPIGKNKMAALASAWQRHFRLLL